MALSLTRVEGRLSLGNKWALVRISAQLFGGNSLESRRDEHKSKSELKQFYLSSSMFLNFFGDKFQNSDFLKVSKVNTSKLFTKSFIGILCLKSVLLMK